MRRYARKGSHEKEKHHKKHRPSKDNRKHPKYDASERYNMLMQNMVDLGYKVDTNGLCFGMDFMYKQALLTGQVDVFEERLKYIDRNMSQLVDMLDPKPGTQVEPRSFHGQKHDVSTTDIRALFDGIALILKPENHSDVLDRQVHKQTDNESIISMVQSPMLEEKGGIHKIGDVAGRYNEQTIQKKMEEIKAAVKESDSDDIVVSITGSGDGPMGHIITLQYKPGEDKWIFMDPNQIYDESKPSQKLKTKDIGDEVWNALGGLAGDDGALFVNFSMTTTEDNYQQLKDKGQTEPFTEFIEDHKQEILISGLQNPKKVEDLAIDAIRTGASQQVTADLIKLVDEVDNLEYTIEHEGKKCSVTALGTAVLRNEQMVIDRILKKGPSKSYINKPDGLGNTALMNAVITNNIDAVKVLLAKGAKVDKVNDAGISPLFVAAQNGAQEVVNTLIARGADVNKLNDAGLSPLFYAAQHGHEDAAKSLVANGADINKADKNGFTPLHYAAQLGQQDVAKLLLSRGADISKTGTTTKEMLLRLTQDKSDDIKQRVRAFINRQDMKKLSADEPVTDEIQITPLELAHVFGNDDIVSQIEQKELEVQQESEVQHESDAQTEPEAQTQLHASGNVDEGPKKEPSTTFTLLEGRLDRNGVVETIRKDKGQGAEQKTVLIFPGNVAHHKPGTTLRSLKTGTGLGKLAGEYSGGKSPLPVLSMPTKFMDNWQQDKTKKALVDSAMMDMYRALGAGYSFALPVRAHDNEDYFKSGLDWDKGLEPSFWGEKVKEPNPELAAFYQQQLTILNKLGSQLDNKNEDEKRQYLDNLLDCVKNPDKENADEKTKQMASELKASGDTAFVEQSIVAMTAGMSKRENDPWFTSSKADHHDVFALLSEMKMKVAKQEQLIDKVKSPKEKQFLIEKKTALQDAIKTIENEEEKLVFRKEPYDVKGDEPGKERLKIFFDKVSKELTNVQEKHPKVLKSRNPASTLIHSVGSKLKSWVNNKRGVPTVATRDTASLFQKFKNKIQQKSKEKNELSSPSMRM
jgi:Ankyrin repeats (3 copies)